MANKDFSETGLMHSLSRTGLMHILSVSLLLCDVICTKISYASSFYNLLCKKVLDLIDLLIMTGKVNKLVWLAVIDYY